MASRKPRAGVEKKLFEHRYGDEPPRLYLYDVTSSYLEGTQNELAAWGYNRDGKKGKLRIVIGLLTDSTGRPVSIEVFPGNTNDLATFGDQVRKVQERFDGQEIVFVGNPVRARELAETRSNKRASIEALVEQKNRYLEEHLRAQPSVAKRDVQAFVTKLKFDRFAEVRYRARTVLVQFDEEEIAEAGNLDGCYAIKTDLLAVDEVDAREVHDRYMELTEVEWAFRTMKTVLLEMRGIFVRKEGRTRAHVFIIMLAYLLAFELRRLWQDQEVTVEEGLSDLAELCATEVSVGSASAQTIPEPRDSGKVLLEATGVSLPDAIPCRNVKVVTRKKLVPERRSS